MPEKRSGDKRDIERELASQGKRRQDTDLVYLARESPKDKPWDKHRSDADTVERMYFDARLEWMQRYGDRISKCADLLDFAYKPTNDDTGEVRLALRRTFFCRVRHCPVCQWRRTLRWNARMLEALPKIQTNYPGYRWIFLTLTVKNCEVKELRNTLNLINAGFRRLTHRKSWPAVGWIKALEITYGNNGEAHPHIHCLMLVKGSYFKKGYISQATWAEMWKKSAKLDYDPIVDVRAFKDKDGDDTKIRKMVAETLKYSVKPDDLTQSAEWLYSLTEALYKTRAISIGGVLKQYLGEEDSDPADSIEGDDTAETEGNIRFNWYSDKKKYARKKKQ